MTTTLSAKSVDEILDFDISFSASNGGGVVGNPSGKIITMFTSIQGDGYMAGTIHIQVPIDELYQLIKDRVIQDDDLVQAEYKDTMERPRRKSEFWYRNKLRASQRKALDELFGVKGDKNGDLLK